MTGKKVAKITIEEKEDGTISAIVVESSGYTKPELERLKQLQIKLHHEGREARAELAQSRGRIGNQRT